jgi:hypothetical protein
MPEPSASARIDIAAPPERVYALVSDLPGWTGWPRRTAAGTWDRRPGWFRPIGGLTTGTMNRSNVNQHNIERTLERLKSTAES